MSKTVLYVLGAVFVAIGLLGFVMDPILGFFEVDTLHNLVHIASGLVFLGVAAFSASNAKMVAVVFGVVYGLVAILGFAMPGDTIFGLIESNMADDVLHTAIAALLLYVGFTDKGDTSQNQGFGGM